MNLAPTITHCPTCGTHLGGLARYCFKCAAYVADMVGSTTDTTPPNRDAPFERTVYESTPNVLGPYVGGTGGG